MKHMVQIQLTTQAGQELEARPGGPGPGSALSGQHPGFTAVVEAKEFGALAGKAMPGAKKLVEG